MNGNQKICPACKGRLIVPNRNGEMQRCPICDGQGVVSPQPIRVPFSYVINRALTALQSVDDSLTFDRDAPFELVWLVATQTGAFTSRLVDSATGRRFDSAAVNNANRFGTAQLPFPLVEPYIFAPGSNLAFNLTDTTGAPNTVQIVLHGFKLYPSAPGENPRV